MEAHGLFNGRGFRALALVWLPAGVEAQALVRFLPETGLQAGSGLSAAMLPMLAGSLALVAPCGAGCRAKVAHGMQPFQCQALPSGSSSPARMDLAASAVQAS